MIPTVELLVEIAKEVENQDPIDWAYLNVSEDNVYRLIASSVLEQYANWRESENSDMIILATITKLIVENFVLNSLLLRR